MEKELKREDDDEGGPGKPKSRDDTEEQNENERNRFAAMTRRLAEIESQLNVALEANTALVKQIQELHIANAALCAAPRRLSAAAPPETSLVYDATTASTESPSAAPTIKQIVLPMGGVVVSRSSDRAPCIVCQTPDDCLDFGEVFARVTPAELVGIREVSRDTETEQQQIATDAACADGSSDAGYADGSDESAGASASPRSVEWEIVFKEGGGGGQLRRLTFDGGPETYDYVTACVEEWEIAAGQAGSNLGVGSKERQEARREIYGCSSSSTEFLRMPSSLEGLSLDVASSALLSTEMAAGLIGAMPLRYKHNGWRLVYSTIRDGTSLSTMYRKSSCVSPTVMVVRDDSGYVFGCFATEAWVANGGGGAKYYGTGETFVFQLVPQMVAYKWARTNSFFMASSSGYVASGGGGESGGAALYIDGELLRGSSSPCETFRSGSLSGKPDFGVKALELWHIA